MRETWSPDCSTRPLTELVWDEGHAGTVLTDEAAPIRVAGSTGWSPTALIAAGVDAALMVSVLETAALADLRVLGYVSATELATAGQDEPCLVLMPTILVPAWEDVVRAHAVIADAFAATPAVRVAWPRVRLQASVEALAGRPAAPEA
ncbi:MAG: hypothetical protein AB7O67_10100 [Vicinamibacterales bacterium]